MRLHLSLLALSVLACSSSLAQAPPAAPEFRGDVRALVREAVEQSPLTRSRELDAQAAQEQVDAARQQYLPTPSASVDSMRGRTLRLTQPLWTGGRLDARLSQAQARASVASLSRDAEAQRLALRVLDIAQAYLVSGGRALAQHTATATLTSLAAMIDRRVAAQISSQSDRTLVTARLAQAQADLAQHAAAQRQAQQQMDQVLGRAAPLTGLQADRPPPSLPALPALQAQACDSAPAVVLARAQEASAHADVAAADAARWPTLSLVAQRSQGAAYGPAADSRLFVSLDYTPGAGTSAANEAAAARLRADAARAGIDSACRDAGEQLAALHGQLESALTRVPHQRRLLSASNDVLASDRRLFVAGRRSWQELLNSAREVSQAELQLRETEALMAVAGARLDLLAGRPIWREAPVPETP